jgi:hypothetical protein
MLVLQKVVKLVCLNRKHKKKKSNGGIAALVTTIFDRTSLSQSNNQKFQCSGGNKTTNMLLIFHTVFQFTYVNKRNV